MAVSIGKINSFFRRIFIISGFFFTFSANAQNVFKDDISFLCSEEAEGRYPGSRGDSIVQSWLEERFENTRLTPLSGTSFRQPFGFTGYFYFHAALRVDRLDGSRELVQGQDFCVAPHSSSDTLRTGCLFIGFGLPDSLHYLMKDKVVIRYEAPCPSFWCDCGYKLTKIGEIAAAGARGVINVLPEGKKISQGLYKGEGRKNKGMILLNIKKESLPLLTGKEMIAAYDGQIDANRIPVFDSLLYCPEGIVSIGVAKMKKRIGSANIIGVKKGAADSYILITAHYDHLGRDPETGKIYPGADDNASGVAMMLRLAGDYSEVRVNSTLIFIAFGAEEKGCIGSKYFVENLPVDKDKIKMVVNLDMLGNLRERTLYYELHPPSGALKSALAGLSDTSLYVNELKEGMTSDHYYFRKHSVPYVFFSTGFGRFVTHTPDDREERIHYEGMCLIRDFLKEVISRIDDL